MWGLLNLSKLAARGIIDMAENAAFNLSGPVAIPGAAFCGKKLLWHSNCFGVLIFMEINAVALQRELSVAV